MQRLILIAWLFLGGFLAEGTAQDTFSIVAVDPTTGEIGSAGATCLDVAQEGASAIIISDILPGRGAIHTQSFWNAINQANARLRMEAGDSPQEIINWLVANDIQGAPGLRQYGIVDFDPEGTPRAAAFTGAQCFDFKADNPGTFYTVQGNILIGPEVLDAMEALFLSTPGSLADRLMAALQGAKVPGADSRCLAEGVSSRSAFLRVARPDDADDNLYLDLRVDVTPFGEEPIDALQAQYDAWLLTSVEETPGAEAMVRIFPNPASGEINLQLPATGAFFLDVYTTTGQSLWHGPVASGNLYLPINAGLYILTVRDEGGQVVFAERYLWAP